MAHKPKSFKVEEAKKTIILYTNVEPGAEQTLINYYLGQGYQPKLAEKKETPTVNAMRKELEADPETLKAFNKAYDEKVKTEKGKKVDFKDTGFAKACKIYNEWKKAQKK